MISFWNNASFKNKEETKISEQRYISNNNNIEFLPISLMAAFLDITDKNKYKY